MDSNQAKGTARNLDIWRLESQINQIGWVKPMVFEQVGSTNDVVIENLDSVTIGQAIVVIANEQTSGRGRLDRKWSTPAGSGIAMSLGVDQGDFEVELSVVPLLCGVAVHRALASLQIPAKLKWPNDIVFTQNTVFAHDTASTNGSVKKVGGILVQLIQNKLVIGIGINVDLSVDELPVPQATSLKIEGFDIDRIELIGKVLEEINKIRKENNQWLDEYKKVCSTIGKNIRVSNFSGEKITGEVIEVTSSGALVVKNLENLYQVTVGDIEHLEVVAD